MTTAEELARQIQAEAASGDDRLVCELKGQLWATCKGLVAGLATKFTPHQPHLREDFTHEGYLEFEQVLGSYDPNRRVPFRGYLALCISRRFLDLVRRRGERHVGNPEGLAPPMGEEVGAYLGRRELGERVRATLAGLLPNDPNRARKLMAFQLRHLEGWSLEEVRAWLSVRERATVSQWVHRVLVAFQAEFPRRHPEYFRPDGPDRPPALEY
jgi:RNA polymerase sigma factor (sigma-70 family)